MPEPRTRNSGTKEGCVTRRASDHAAVTIQINPDCPTELCMRCESETITAMCPGMRQLSLTNLAAAA